MYKIQRKNPLHLIVPEIDQRHYYEVTEIDRLNIEAFNLAIAQLNEVCSKDTISIFNYDKTNDHSPILYLDAKVGQLIEQIQIFIQNETGVPFQISEISMNTKQRIFLWFDYPDSSLAIYYMCGYTLSDDMISGKRLKKFLIERNK